MPETEQHVTQSSDNGAKAVASPIVPEQVKAAAAAAPHVNLLVEEERSARLAISVDDAIPRVKALAAKMRQGIHPNLDVRVQRELGDLISYLPLLTVVKNPSLIDEADMIASALLADPPNLTLARQIRRQLHAQIRRDRLINSSPASAVSMGLAVVAYFLLPISFLFAFLWGQLGSDRFLDVPVHTYVLVYAFGATGSMVSIMVRIQQFTYKQYKNSLSLFLTGLFRPLIGIGFAFFIFAALESGIVAISFPPGKDAFFYAAISFVAGFSERFGQNIAGKAESFADADPDSDTTVHTSQETVKRAHTA